MDLSSLQENGLIKQLRKKKKHMEYLGLNFNNFWSRIKGPLVSDLKQNNSKYGI
jgi:hypothetical protein